MSLEKKLRDFLLRANILLNNKKYMDVNDQKLYICKLHEPKDDFERSYLQYKCQMHLMTKTGVLFYTLASFLMCFFYRPKNKNMGVISCDAVFINDGIGKKIIPNSIKEEYKHIEVVDVTETGFYDEDVDGFIKEIKARFPFSTYLYFKCLVKISLYNMIIKKYNPRAIITYSETSFCSSLATHFLNKRNIKHINVMHGEKYYYIRDSFFRYNRFYVWDQYYSELFINLRAEPTQFLVERPACLLVDLSRYKDERKRIDITYYLQEENDASIKIIIESMKRLSKKYSFKIRPHPRMIDSGVLNKIDKEYIQNPFSISIEESIANTKYVIAKSSTVLYQGYLVGRQIVIDDLSDAGLYEYLRQTGYIMLTKPHCLLSALLKEKM